MDIWGIANSSQSSRHHVADSKKTGRSSRALDGNTSTQSHTQYEQDPWWRISFKKVIEVHYIVIRSRQDCCWERLNDFSIFYGDNVDSVKTCVTHQNMSGSFDQTFTCGNCVVLASCLQVTLYGQGVTLSIAEFEIYGNPVD